MQSMANRYARYYNAKHTRTGTIWEGRYKSCLVDSDSYLFTLYKYIELNPVRSGIVRKPHEYVWSSYRHNALGQTDKLIVSHTLYQELGQTVKQRSEAYLKMFEEMDSKGREAAITGATERGEVYGTDKFHKKVSKLISRPLLLASHGGDRKSEAYKNQAG